MGVFGSRLLDRLGPPAPLPGAVALNDYAVAIPVADTSLPGASGIERDGRPCPRVSAARSGSSIPGSNILTLDDRVHRQRSIWQLSAIEVA